MSPFGKKIDQVVEADLQALIDAGYAENRIMEYKAELPGGSDGDKFEFLRDVVSFSNSAGGYIVYGMEADKNAAPQKLRGIPSETMDRQRLRLEQILRMGIEPVIHGLKIESVPLPVAGGSALIIEIPRGIFGPHMIKGRRAFIGRTSAGKMDMDYGEIRSAFIGAETASTKLVDFRAQRIAALVNGETVVPLSRPKILAIHVLPLESFTPAYKCELSRIAGKDEDRALLIPGPRSWPWQSRFTLDGFMQLAAIGEQNLSGLAYAYLFRNGSLEVINCDSDTFGMGIRIEFSILSAAAKMLRVLKRLEIPPPYYVYPSLLNVRGAKLVIPQYDYRERQEREIRHDHLHLPEVLLDDSSPRLEQAFRSSFDVLWNSCGWSGSPHYDTHGNYPKWQER